MYRVLAFLIMSFISFPAVADNAGSKITENITSWFTKDAAAKEALLHHKAFRDGRLKFRYEQILKGIDKTKKIKALEISPNWAPLILKDEFDVLYTDRASYDELLAREETNPSRLENKCEVLPLDFVWQGGKTLKQSLPDPEQKFDLIVASHVMEHVPDFITWLESLREILSEDGRISLVLPNSEGSGEYIRDLSSTGEAIDAWVNQYQHAAPWQVYDGLTRITEWKGKPEKKELFEMKRWYTEKEAVQAAFRVKKEYIDIHCWAFTPQSFLSIANELEKAGVWAFEKPIITASPEAIPAEFYIHLKPKKNFILQRYD